MRVAATPPESWAAYLLRLLAAFALAGLLAGGVEFLVYGGSSGVLGLLSLLAMAGAAALLLSLALAVPLRLLSSRVAPRLAPQAAGWSPAWLWILFLSLFFLAFVPYPIFFVLARSATTITDSALAVRFTSSAAVLGVALSLAVTVVLAGASFALLGKFGLLSFRPGPALFWGFAFPMPWLLVPFAVVLKDAELLAPAMRFLLPLLIITVGPLMALLIRGLPRIARSAVGALVPLFVVSLGITVAAGWTFSQKGLAEAPFGSLIFDHCRQLADLDGDGATALFDGLDCDEGDATIYAQAHDVPGNGIDEDCDGVDAEVVEGLVLGDSRPYPYEFENHYNVIFIMVDALRADHLHFMGYKRKTSPNIDRLAAESLVFTNAVSQYPSTGISVPSMLSGVYPEYMFWGKPKRSSQYILKKQNVLITDVLRQEGYTTVAIVSAWIKRNIEGLKRHFVRLDGLYPHDEWKKWVRDSSRLSVKQAIKFFNAYDGETPFFLFLHMEDPHEPYVVHGPPGKSFGKKKVDRYDSDIHWTDLWLGFLLGYIEQEPWFANTVVILVADHGEEFKEHGKGFHGHQLYQESIHVPLIMKIPGMEPRQIETRVAMVDIFPTLLDLTGISHPREALQGVSLLRTAFDPDPMERPVFSMLADREKRPTYRVKGILKGRYKLLRDLTNQRDEFYDLESDPGEQDDLADRGLLAHEELGQLLQTFLRNSEPDWKLY
jgi:arylsulfatase A-like enzyme